MRIQGERSAGAYGGGSSVVVVVVGRVVETKAMREYLARMKQRAVKALYKKRCEIAEFPHLWVKGVKQLRRFSVRGVVKAGMEALWVALAYNVTQWIRIRPALAAVA